MQTTLKLFCHKTSKEMAQEPTRDRAWRKQERKARMLEVNGNRPMTSEGWGSGERGRSTVEMS